MSAAKTVKVICLSCGGETNHRVLQNETRSKTVELADGYVDTWFGWSFQIVECLGCESVSFRKVTENSDYSDDEGVPLQSVQIYPVRVAGQLSIKTYYSVPPKLRNIYRETMDAFNNSMWVLCAGGLRATIEGICLSQGVQEGPVEAMGKDGSKVVQRRKDLQGRIGGLHERGLLTKTHAEVLHEHRFIGNDALHTLGSPSQQELRLALEIVEHTLDNLFELPLKVDEIRSSRQARQK